MFSGHNLKASDEHALKRRGLLKDNK